MGGRVPVGGQKFWSSDDIPLRKMTTVWELMTIFPPSLVPITPIPASNVAMATTPACASVRFPLIYLALVAYYESSLNFQIEGWRYWGKRESGCNFCSLVLVLFLYGSLIYLSKLNLIWLLVVQVWNNDQIKIPLFRGASRLLRWEKKRVIDILIHYGFVSTQADSVL